LGGHVVDGVPEGAPWRARASRHEYARAAMGCLILLFLLLALVFAGIGFAAHLLWVVAVVFFVFWLAGYAFARGQRRAWRRRRP